MKQISKQIKDLNYQQLKNECIKYKIKVIGVRIPELISGLKKVTGSDSIMVDDVPEKTPSKKPAKDQAAPKSYVAPEVASEKAPEGEKVSKPKKEKVVKPAKVKKEKPEKKERIKIEKKEIPDFKSLAEGAKEKVKQLEDEERKIEQDLKTFSEGVTTSKVALGELRRKLNSARKEFFAYFDERMPRQNAKERDINSFSPDVLAIRDGEGTKSNKIRLLSNKGLTVADIAFVLSIRYQHAREVLTPYQKKDKK